METQNETEKTKTKTFWDKFESDKAFAKKVRTSMTKNLRTAMRSLGEDN